jgi:hypothetical protein
VGHGEGHGEDHAEDHGAGHRHDAPGEAHNASAGQGPVLLDVGDGAGALVLVAPGGMHLVEIEVSPVGRGDERTHVAVLPRPTAAGPVFAAVYPTLAAGPWTVWSPEPPGEAVLVVDVPDGGTVHATWPAC